MCRSTIRFSCARLMMLSLKGARQISGNNVTMSILIGEKTSNAGASDTDASISFHNLEHRALAVTRCRAGQQSADSVNRLTRPANHTAHVSASELQLKSDCSAVRNFREHHVVRKFDQLANDELE